MRITRRTLLAGAGAGALGVLIAACTPEPAPSPTPDRSPTPEPTNDDTVTPSAFARSAWSTDPFALGAVSFTPVGVLDGSRDALAESVDDRLFFAGEATDAEAPGTLLGALRAGERGAGDVLVAASAGERIAVIGAGITGALAAQRIAATGTEVTVFEARDRVGGRVQSVVDEERWPFPIQLGGWLFDQGDEQVAERLAALDIRTETLSAPRWRGADGDVDAPSDEPLQNAIDAASALPADISITDALAAAGADPDDPALAALLGYLATTAGADADALSTWFPPRLPVAAPTAPIGDLGELFTELLDGVTVRLSSPVSRIAYDDAGVSLGMATGESLSFDRVVITVPLGVLQDDAIEFAPKLPFAYRGAIAALGMGAIETVWLRFDEPLVETDATIWHTVGVEEDAEGISIRTWLNLAPLTGENVLAGLVGGEAAKRFAALSDDEARAAAAASLAPFLVPASD